MQDEDENVVGDDFDADEDADLDEIDGENFDPDEEDSYDPDDRYH